MIKMRRQILNLFAVILILFSQIFLAMAQTTCTDEQTILKLSATTNAHGEAFNGAGNYPVRICYNAIFGSDFSGTSPHSCSGNNIVLKLSSDTNAHAESPSGTAYTTNVCYGNLQCVLRDACESGERLVVSLSDITNSHLASDSSFIKKICCKAAELSGTIWTNLLGQQISSTDVNDTIRLNAFGAALAGEQIKFTIFKDVPFWFDTVVSQSSSAAFMDWKANESGTFYFKAKILSTGIELQSGNLVVSAVENNAPPIAGIDVPKHGAVYTRNRIVFFNHTSFDADDNFNITWIFGDGQTQSFENCRTNNCNATHQYADTKVKTIKLIITDYRGKTSEIVRNIMIIDLLSTFYPFPLVHAPVFNEYKTTQLVFFNATSSFMLKSEGGALTCLAGNCPSQTSDAVAVPIANTPQLLDSLNFTWSIDSLIKRSKLGLDGATFSLILPTQGKHTVTLDIFTQEATDRVQINFTTGTAAGFCSADRRTWTNPDGTVFQTVGTNNAEFCKHSTPKCCPNGFTCVDGLGAGKGCQETINTCDGINLCSHYTSQSNCEDDICGVGLSDGAEFSLNNCGKFISGKFVNCLGCRFNTAENKCQFRKEFTDFDPNSNAYSCEISSDVSECVGNRRIVSWTGVIKDSNGNEININTLPADLPQELIEECKNEQKTYKCGLSAKLPFFGLIQFLTALGIILIFYMLRRK